ncbi:MAG: hypothetical protein CVT98_02755 [Bacteroidetes bacterium HGW-Bacteroidetes-15]|nr:MAG: hypothetical protein CVT98_02755 [Bacteroidetes bacterium HGW-Bacteroidetes-15]
MKKIILGFIFLFTINCTAQDWHVNIEPVYFFVKAPNVAIDYNINSSFDVGIQYAALNWGENGNNLSGIQLFYSRTSGIKSNTEVLKIYIGLLSPNTTMLKIEAKENPLPVYEILYGYRWVIDGKFTVGILAGTFFTSKNIYPGISIPVGLLL